MKLQKVLVGLIVLTTVMSLFAVVGMLGAGVSGRVVQEVNPLFDSMSIGVGFLILIGIVLLFVELRLYNRGN